MIDHLVVSINVYVSRSRLSNIYHFHTRATFLSFRPVDPEQNIREAQEEPVKIIRGFVHVCATYICLLLTVEKTKITGITSSQSEKAKITHGPIRA